MADEARQQEVERLGALVDHLNGALSGVTPYKLAVVDPARIEHVEKNAHYMSKAVYDRLVENVKTDGNLSTLPFCWRRPDGTFVALSGNHRRDAAVEAGIPLILVLYTDQQLSRAAQVSIQLSHNAIVGQDNSHILAELWREIDRLEWKVYSGLDDKLIESMDKVSVVRINEAPLRFEEMRLLFVQPEIERIKEVLERLGNAAKPRLAARYEDFDRFFETLLSYKEASGIVNTATAVGAMMDIVEAWMAEHADAERNEGEHEPQDG